MNLNQLNSIFRFACCDGDNVIRFYDIELAINLTNAKIKNDVNDSVSILFY